MGFLLLERTHVMEADSNTTPGNNAQSLTQSERINTMEANTSNATSAPTNGGTTNNRPNRIPKDDVRNYRLKFQGAERSLASITKKLEAIEKELDRKTITSTRRKSLQAKRVKLLATQDMKKVALQLAKQRINSYLSHNTKIAVAERRENRQDSRSKMVVAKHLFALRSFYTAANSPLVKEQLFGLVNGEDSQMRARVAQFIGNNPRLKVTLPADGTDECKALLSSLTNWIESLKGKSGASTVHSMAEAA
jgi:hypothetical protein